MVVTFTAGLGEEMDSASACFKSYLWKNNLHHFFLRFRMGCDEAAERPENNCVFVLAVGCTMFSPDTLTTLVREVGESCGCVSQSEQQLFNLFGRFNGGCVSVFLKCSAISNVTTPIEIGRASCRERV